MLALARRHNLAADYLYTLVLTGKLYIALSEAPLAQPARVRVFFSQSQGEAFITTPQATAWHKPGKADLEHGAQVEGDGQFYEIIHRGETGVWLKSWWRSRCEKAIQA